MVRLSVIRVRFTNEWTLQNNLQCSSLVAHFIISYLVNEVQTPLTICHQSRYCHKLEKQGEKCFAKDLDTDTVSFRGALVSAVVWLLFTCFFQVQFKK